MTTDTTTNTACVACKRDTTEGSGRASRRPFAADDGSVRYWCGPCYSAADIANLRGYRWLPTHPSNQPTPPPRTARPYGGRRVDVHVQGGCTMCGRAVDDEWPEVLFELAGLQVLGRRCAGCDGGIRSADFDALAYLRAVHGREQLTSDDFYAGVCLWHQREGLRPPPPAPEPWAF